MKRVEDINNKIIIRIATTLDVIALTDLMSDTFRESWLNETNKSDLEEYISLHFSLTQISNEILNPNISYLLLEIDGTAAGYCKLERFLQPEDSEIERPLSISKLYVKKAFQNLKLGSKLLKQVILLAEKEKFKIIWLGVWIKNAAAVRFYNRFGFRKFGMCKFIMGNDISDDYLMKRLV